MRRRLIALGALAYLLEQSSLVLAKSEAATEDLRPPEAEDYLYAKSTVIWHFSDQPHLLFVCWEPSDADFKTEKTWVENEVKATWGANAPIEFKGWETTCQTGATGIRIKVADDKRLGAHTKGLGAALDGVAGGMVLNFTFKQWNKPCREKREKCIRAIAVHEFGHALGFAHEHNRPDKPDECIKPRQGSKGDMLLTSYDPDSVMNYCSEYKGKLSPKDIIGLQKAYPKTDDRF